MGGFHDSNRQQPVDPYVFIPPSYRTCTAPCMTTIMLTNSHGTPTNDTTSSIFYDYGGDAAYVEDQLGLLHKFTQVFNAKLAEVRTGARSAHWTRRSVP
jgi:hypothetical protein